MGLGSNQIVTWQVKGRARENMGMIQQVVDGA